MGLSTGGALGGSSSRLEIPGTALPPEASTIVLFCNDRLLDTLGIPVIRGRQISALEVEQLHHVAVINETLAKRHFGNEEPLGRTIRLPRLTTLPVPVPDPTFEIVGVVRDVANQGPREPPEPEVFIPYAFRGPANLTFVVRTSSDPSHLISTVRERIQSVDRQVAVLNPISFEENMQRGFFARPRFSLLILGIFACTGTLLVAFGIFGVLAYSVSQQTREIAIRIALGGDRSHVMAMVVRLGLRLVAVGLVLGLAASFATNRLIAAQLWNVSPHDPTTFAAAVSVIVGVALLACWIPARRALSVEPTVALRQE